jgi:outer membrane protein assembly factor BamD
MNGIKPVFIFCFILSIGLGIPLSGEAALIYRPGQGWEVEGSDQVAETSKEQIEKGERLEKEGKLEEAANAYRLIVRNWPLSPNAPEGQYRYAVLLYKLYDFNASFKAFQKCVEQYPDSEHFDQILRYQYDIACLFLAGERQKLWKIPTLPSMDKSVEMFEQVIKNGPYSKVAAMCQIKIGFAREKQRRWIDAVSAYKEVIRRYPKSDLADDAQFQIGYAYMLASAQAEYDQTSAHHAITAFQDYITKYPNSEKIEQARENISGLRIEQARGYMTIAEFYDRQGSDDAALIYYNSVIQKYPQSNYAKDAAVRADQIRKQKYGNTSTHQSPKNGTLPTDPVIPKDKSNPSTLPPS